MVPHVDRECMKRARVFQEISDPSPGVGYRMHSFPPAGMPQACIFVRLEGLQAAHTPPGSRNGKVFYAYI